MVSTTGMVVSLKTDLRFPESGQQGHGAQIIHVLIAHRKAPFIVGVATGTVKHLQATLDYSFLVVKVDYICHEFRVSNIELLQLICN